MDHPKFVIEPLEAQSLTQQLNLPSILHLLPTLVQPSQPLARPPVSNFHVAAVGLGSDGRIYIGVNLEFPHLPLHHSIHAEQFLVTNIAANNCPSLVAFAVSAPPCAHCRQFLQELRHSSLIKICITSEQNVGRSLRFNNLSELLPSPFGPNNLLDGQKPLLLEEKNNGLVLSKRLDFCRNNEDLRHGFCEKGDKKVTLLMDGALKVAHDSITQESKRLDFYSNNEDLSNVYCEKDEKEETLLKNSINDGSKRLDFYSNKEDLRNGYGGKKEAILIDEALKVVDDSIKEGSKRLDFYSNHENLSNGYGEKGEMKETLLIDEALKIAKNEESKRLDFYSNNENLSKKERILIDEALKAANDSHAPYSGCPSGVALMDCDGNVYRGSYIESAAYNPSLGPVQAALVSFVAGGGGGYERIVAAVLVEKEGGVVLQEDTAKIILKKVVPKCDLKVIHCFQGEN